MVEVNVVGKALEEYQQMGYDTIQKGKYMIWSHDILPGSDALIRVLCDYCLENKIENIYFRQKKYYTRDTTNGIIKKDACKQCVGLKTKESNFKKYGVSNATDVRRKLNTYKPPTNKYTIQQAKSIFEKKNFTLLENEYKGCHTLMSYICNLHPFDIQQMTLVNARLYGNCRFCRTENTSGPKSSNWKDGISNIAYYFREVIKDWKYDSMQNCNFRCVITGGIFDEVHHLVGFNEILRETLSQLGLSVRQSIKMYSAKELFDVSTKLIENHYKYPLGVCIKKEFHENFHSLYGWSTTPEQFYEYISIVKNQEEPSKSLPLEISYFS